jgi:AcrR family transcriptional regulator
MARPPAQSDSPPLAVLPRGPHSLSREAIQASQRARLLAAAIDVVATKGYASTVVADVIARASVSRRTLYELFEDFEACLLEAFVVGGAGLVEEVSAAEGGVEGALRAYFRALGGELGFARVLLLEASAAGPAVLDAREELHDRLAQALVPAPTGGRRRAGLPNVTGRIVLGAANELAAGLLFRGRAAQLDDLVPLLVGITER